MDGLTDIQYEYLRLIARFIEKEGYSPTRRELAKLTSQKSVNGVRQHLNALKNKGFVKFDPPGRPRNIHIIQMPQIQLSLFEEEGEGNVKRKAQ